mgnify:CR=1 FL=1
MGIVIRKTIGERAIGSAENEAKKIKDDAAKWDVVPTKIEMNEVLSIDITPPEMRDLTGKGGDK